MFCMHCGKQLPDNARFCMKCGTLVGEGEVKNEVKDDTSAENIVSGELTDNTVNIVNENTVVTPSTNNTNFEEIDEDEDEDIVEPIQQPSQEESNEVEEEDDDDDEEDFTPISENTEDEDSEEIEDDDDVDEPIAPQKEFVKPDVSKLSVAAGIAEQPIRSSELSQINPAEDPYWDSVLPEINDEINQIPKDLIVKGIGITIAFFAVVAWLIYML